MRPCFVRQIDMARFHLDNRLVRGHVVRGLGDPGRGCRLDRSGLIRLRRFVPPARVRWSSLYAALGSGSHGTVLASGDSGSCCGGLHFRGKRCGILGRRRHLDRLDRLRLGLLALLEGDLLFELLFELARHGAGPPQDLADLRGNLGQPFGSQHDQRQDEDNQDLGKTDVEHAV